MCKILIKKLVKESELRIGVEKQWNNYSTLDTNVKNLLALIGAVRDTNRKSYLEALRFSESETSVKTAGKIEKRLADPEEKRDKRDKNTSKKRKHSSGSTSTKDTDKKQDVSGKACNFCGHQLGVKHLDGLDGNAATCTLRAHPQSNKSGAWQGSKLQLEWSRSSNNIRGGVHYSKLMDGTAWVNPDSNFKPQEKKSKHFLNIHDDIYFYDDILSNINSNRYKSNPYLSIKLFQNSGKEVEERSIKVQALLDTGSLAGDFISDEVLSNLPSPLLVYNTDFTVCSGMDGNCINKLDAIDLCVSMCTENAL
jgi:hypothetical protein